MHKKLLEILSVKKGEVAKLKQELPRELDRERSPVRDFKGAISAPQGINLIAEIKFASPSAGQIREFQDPISIGKVYESSGAAAISFLTDKEFFKGDIQEIPHLKKALSIPILRKDFIIHEVQLREASLYEADAVLLIARILSRNQLKELISASKELGMFQLVEIHDMEDLEKAIDSSAEIIGINNRDLDTFKIDLNTTYGLIKHIPEDAIRVCESGILVDEDIRMLKKTNIQAVLVGSALMMSDTPGEKVREFVEAGKGGPSQ